MAFVGKENFKVGDAWLTDLATTHADNLNDETFGTDPLPFALAALKADAKHGDMGTGKPANIAHVNTETFGTDPVPATLVALKADAVYGDSGTGHPANGAGANDAAWAASRFVLLGDDSLATWNGTAWVVAVNPRDAAFAAGDFVVLGDESKADWNGTAWITFVS
jgi:hypothetical protein